ncbi:beta-1,2-xylosyltransferase XYXT1-like [Typha angustifolia]|uniref:beta-1,2-xylosyltransferase XYXT1-like n=1 Tax=Typha angustifolia TaxID=59011 RepID=UPI003C2E104F
MALEMKAIKNLKQILPQSRVSYGLVVGFFFVLLTYFTMSEQFAIRAPNALSQPTSGYEINTSPSTEETKSSPELGLEEKTQESKPDPKPVPVKKDEVIIVQKQQSTTPNGDAEETQQFGDVRKSEETHKDFGGGVENLNQAPAKKLLCDITDHRSDFCDVEGDVRTHGISSTVMLVPPTPGPNPDPHEWSISPYSRKHLEGIKKVTVKSLNGPHEAPPCSIKQSIPAVVFALGGHTGNYWHDFSDVLIPLFVASRQFDGEVQFLITNIQGWYMGKYKMILHKLSRYEMIDFDKDGAIRCYPHVIVGVKSHKDFSIDPSKAPNGYTMSDFRKFMRMTYSLPRDYPIRLSDNSTKKPRLLIIARGLSRRFTNVPEIVKSAENLGFEVVVVDAKFDVNIAEFSQIVNSCDVMLGVHGAGLTNCIFLPTNAVMIQVVPYGKIEFIAKMDFGDPAVDMNIQYLEYSISAEESTLMDTFGKDHPLIKDPDSIHRSGWQKVGEFYLGKQDVRLDLNRFAPTLLKAKELLRG